MSPKAVVPPNSPEPEELVVRQLGRREYLPVLEEMRRFTSERGPQTPDELWLVEHPPVFTQGQAGRAEHLLNPGDIPVISTERGGQVTYHGPGQLVAYPLLDLRRLRLGVRDLVTLLEDTVVALLNGYGIDASAKREAPGVYVKRPDEQEYNRKIASLGLRVRRGCSFHGVAINVDTDLAPFLRINPCGYAGLQMTRIADEITGAKPDVAAVGNSFAAVFAKRLGTHFKLKNSELTNIELKS